MATVRAAPAKVMSKLLADGDELQETETDHSSVAKQTPLTVNVAMFLAIQTPKGALRSAAARCRPHLCPVSGTATMAASDPKRTLAHQLHPSSVRSWEPGKRPTVQAICAMHTTNTSSAEMIGGYSGLEHDCRGNSLRDGEIECG